MAAIVVALGLGGAVAAADAGVKENWVKHCQRCHGADGRGQTVIGKRLNLRDYTDPKFHEAFSDAELIRITREGSRKGGRVLMKPYAGELSEREIQDLVEYIRRFKK